MPDKVKIYEHDDTDCRGEFAIYKDGSISADNTGGEYGSVCLTSSKAKEFASEIFKAQGVTVIECPHKIGDTIWTISAGLRYSYGPMIIESYTYYSGQQDHIPGLFYTDTSGFSYLDTVCFRTQEAAKARCKELNAKKGMANHE